MESFWRRAAGVAAASLVISCAGGSHPPVTVAVSPAAVDLIAGDTQQFTATVSGSDETGVRWWVVGDGTIDADGTYHAPEKPYAPATTVIAEPLVAGERGTATIHLRARAPVLTAVTSPAVVGDTVTISGAGFDGYTTILFPTAGESIRVQAEGMTPTAITAKVPVGATDGLLSVELALNLLEPVRSNALPFTRAPRIRLRAERADVGAGGSTALRVAWLGAPGPAPLTFATDVGAVIDDRYVAPASVVATSYAHVTACITGTGVCDGLVIGIHPFTVEPDPALVPAGGSLKLRATAGEPVSAAWSLFAGGGSVSADGTYQASAAPEDAGPAWLAAAAGGTTVRVQVAVTGQNPGLLGRLADHIDLNAAAPEGTSAEAIAVEGSKGYVLGCDVYSCEYAWIDVYDLTDPVRPVWRGAVESATAPGSMFVAQGRLLVSATTPHAGQDAYGAWDQILAIYDLSGELPALLGRHLWVETGERGQVRPGWLFDGERIYLIRGPAAGARTIELDLYDPTDPAFVSQQSAVLQLPSEADPALVDAVAVSGPRAYVSYAPSADPSLHRLAVYDLVPAPPALVKTVDAGGGALAIAGPYLVANTNISETLVFDRTDDALWPPSTLPFGGELVALAGPDRVVFKTYQSGPRIVDLSEPAAPRVATALFNGTRIRRSGVLMGDRLMTAEGWAGLATYDVGPSGGPIRGASVSIPSWASPKVYDLSQRGANLYATGADYFGVAGWVATFDTSADPPSLLGVATLDDVGLAVTPLGSSVAVGTATELAFVDVSSPTAPRPIASLPIPTSCIGSVGSAVFVGGPDGSLTVVDATDPRAPAIRGTVSLGRVPNAIRPLQPGMVAVALAGQPDGALSVVDVSSPTAPRVLGSVPLDAPAFSVGLQDTSAYLATGTGVAVVDVSIPAAPVLLEHFQLPCHDPFGYTCTAALPTSIAVGQGIAWVGTGEANGMLLGYDVRDPLRPRLVSESAFAAEIEVFVSALALDGNGRAYVAGSAPPFAAAPEFGLFAVDVSRPRNLILELQAPAALRKPQGGPSQAHGPD